MCILNHFTLAYQWKNNTNLMCIKFYVTAELFTSIDPLAYYFYNCYCCCYCCYIWTLVSRFPSACSGREPLGLVERGIYWSDVFPATQTSLLRHWGKHGAITLTNGMSSSLFHPPWDSWWKGYRSLYAGFPTSRTRTVVRECWIVRTTTKVFGEWQSLTPPVIAKPLKRSSPKFE